MRHLAGIALAIVAALVLFFAGSWGYLRLLRAAAVNGSLRSLPAGGGALTGNHNVLEALAALLVTGLVIGIVVGVPRISPLAAGLPGLAMLALTGLYLASVRHAVQLIPLRNRAFGAGFEAMLIDGVLALAGLAMIVPMFVPSRWRRASRRDWAGRPVAGGGGPAASGLLATDATAPQGPYYRQGPYYPEQDQFPTQGLPVQHEPFPPQEPPFPPQR
jgi:hypothetical protein